MSTNAHYTPDTPSNWASLKIAPENDRETGGDPDLPTDRFSGDFRAFSSASRFPARNEDGH